jgi:hypothetical protein
MTTEDQRYKVRSLKEAANRADITEQELRDLIVRLGYSDDGYTLKAPSVATASTAFGSTPLTYAQAIGRPPFVAEMPPSRFFSISDPVELDRFALNPGEAIYRQLLPGARFAYSAPTMFASGDLPIITGSGVDPSLLVWCAWYYRHSAALTDSRAHVLEIIEESASPAPNPDELQTPLGRDRWQNYLTRVNAWVSTPPPQKGLPTGTQALQDQMRELYGPNGGQ